jgi:hypothetical protein
LSNGTIGRALKAPWDIIQKVDWVIYTNPKEARIWGPTSEQRRPITPAELKMRIPGVNAGDKIYYRDFIDVYGVYPYKGTEQDWYWYVTVSTPTLGGVLQAIYKGTQNNPKVDIPRGNFVGLRPYGTSDWEIGVE